MLLTIIDKVFNMKITFFRNNSTKIIFAGLFNNKINTNNKSFSIIESFKRRFMRINLFKNFILFINDSNINSIFRNINTILKHKEKLPWEIYLLTMTYA